MHEIHWARRGLELRFDTDIPVARYALRSDPRKTHHDPFHQAYQPSMTAVGLPAALVPLVTGLGRPVDPSALVTTLPDGAVSHPTRLIVPRPEALSRVLPALWLQGVDEAALEQLRQTHDLADVLLIDADERAVALSAPAEVLYLHPLPRVVLAPSDEIADNTDDALSMDHLLDAFVERFATAEDTLPELRLATGYLHRHGLRRILDLLTRDTPPERLQILFSGKTDRTGARHLTALFSEQIRDALDETRDPDAFVDACRAAVESGQLDVRVYTPAFLHAKLFLGWQKRDRHDRLVGSIAVVGSSNLTGPGLRAGGNLELDVTVNDRDVNTRLAHWFAHRWDEAEPPEPPLLEVIDRWRPPPPPAFETPGLAELYTRGQKKQLGDPRDHLAWLARLYADRIARVPLSDEPAFPPADEVGATVTPKVEQVEGVHALALRLLQNRLAFLADSVGLGKTITAIGTAWHLRRRGHVTRCALIAPRKLWDQWAGDGRKIGAPDRLLEPVNRHTLERQDDEGAAAELAPYDLLVVEEAHESLRNRGNKLWQHLRAHLTRRLDCTVLLISATPWNNSREDIYNYLRLGLADGSILREHYIGLAHAPIVNYLPLFQNPQARSAARQFCEMPLEPYRDLFGAFFVQRTRRVLERRGLAGDFPERRPHPVETDPKPRYVEFFTKLATTLADLYLAHRDPFGALLRAVDATDADPPPAGTDPESNLHRSLVIGLYKRAESSLFALAISLAGLRRRLSTLRALLEDMHGDDDPRGKLREWLDKSFLSLSQDTLDLIEDYGDQEPLPGLMTPAEKARYARLEALLARIDDARARDAIRYLQTKLIDPNIATIEGLAKELNYALEDRDPKAIELVALAKHHARQGHKPVLIGGYADTAMRMFIRLTEALPSRRIGLALGGGQGWLYDPNRHRGAPAFDADAFARALATPTRHRRDVLLTGRAQPMDRRHLIAAFAPRAQTQLAIDFPPDAIGGEIDILVGSEAISVGQNLQDSTALIQLDMPWNPMIIEQRIGRVDRHGGGRPDPTDDERRIVDIHYAWSTDAIDAELTLRDKLNQKALGALTETGYDELLLHELREQIQQVRAERDGRPTQALVDRLAALHRDLADQQSRVPDILERSGSFLDGLRALARLVKSGEVDPDAAPDPLIATGRRPLGGDHQWLLGVRAVPHTRGGPQPARHVHLPLPAALDPFTPDLLAVVEELAAPTEPTPAPRLDLDASRGAPIALDRRLQTAARELIDRHNAEVDRRATEALRPHRRRDPSDALKRAMVEARAAIDRVLGDIKRRRDRARADQLKPRAAQINALRRALDPAAVFDLLGQHPEPTLHAELQLIKANPERFLLDADRFDPTFRLLMGDRWPPPDPSNARVIDNEAQTVLEIDDRWTALDLTLDAACWVTP